MKRNTKRSIYVRIFSAFLATYMVMMIGFTAFLVSLEKEAAGNEFGDRASQISDRVDRILKDSINDKKQIIDLPGIKNEFLESSPVYMLDNAEAAIFTSDYNLVYSTYNRSDYLLCIYNEPEESSNGYGLLNLNEWFNEEERSKLVNYLYAKPKVEKVGDLAGYSIHIDSFWLDDEMIIPHSISVSRMYARELDEEGNAGGISGSYSKGNFLIKDFDNINNLPYIDYQMGALVLEENGNFINSKNQDELREIVKDESNLINYLQQLLQLPISTSMEPIERVNMLTYRYYLVVPYQSSYRMLDNQSLYSEFYTAVAIDIDIWERVSSTLTYVWTACLVIFSTAAYILSGQTYKTYLKQEELERQRKEMTDALAHDLKTPLSIISGYAQNLHEDVHTEKREHYTSHITSNVNRMDKIIRQMLEMSRLESDSFELKFEEASLSDICTEIINRYKQVCDEKFITVSLNGEASIKADKSLVERIIDNFFINAIDHTPEGGRIIIKILENTFEIFNSGSHIPEDKIKEIWYPYKKVNTERSNTKGTGLGLSISRTILELHKFSYGVKNTEDGVIFWFKFSK